MPKVSYFSTHWRRLVSEGIPVRIWLIGFACGVLVPFAVILGYTLHDTARSERRHATETVTQLARSLADAVERQLQAYLDLAQSMAAARHLQINDLAVFEEIARDTAARSRVNLVLIDPQFHQVINTRAPPGAPLPLTRQADNVTAVLEAGRPFVSDLRASTYAGEQTFAVIVPVSTEDGRRYVLALAPDRAVLSNIIAELHLPDGWLGAVHDRKNRFLARSVNEEKFIGEHAPFWDPIVSPSGQLETTDREGRASIVAFNKIDLSGWRAIIWAPKDVLYQQSTRLQYWTFTVFAVSLATSFILAFLFGRKVEQPISELSRAARDLGAGQPVAMLSTPLREARTVGAALVKASDDIWQREKALHQAVERSDYLAKELAHRLKNQLALITAMARQAKKSAISANDFAHSFEQRLLALGQSADLLLRNEWRNVHLAELVATQLQGFSGLAQIATSGPDVLLGPTATHYVGIALHELATNAAKYGALSLPTGRVDLTWKVCGKDLTVRWIETRGPPVKPPDRQGFGQHVTGRVVASAVSGRAQSDYPETGLIWTLTAPLSGLR